MTVYEFLKSPSSIVEGSCTYQSMSDSYTTYLERYPVQCGDGMRISIQQSDCHCSAEGIPNVLPASVEVIEYDNQGVHSGLYMRYAESWCRVNEGCPSAGTLWGCMPIDILEDIIEEHGGIAAICDC